MTRRDKCFVNGRRVVRLHGIKAERFCGSLGLAMMDLGDLDLPKFNHLLEAIRKATIKAGKL